jgi:hypothetical protein
MSIAQRSFGWLGHGWRFRLRGFETESLLVRSKGIWPCVYVLKTVAVENTHEVDRQPTWLECWRRLFEELNAELFWCGEKITCGRRREPWHQLSSALYQSSIVVNIFAKLRVFDHNFISYLLHFPIQYPSARLSRVLNLWRLRVSRLESKCILVKSCFCHQQKMLGKSHYMCLLMSCFSNFLTSLITESEKYREQLQIKWMYICKSRLQNFPFLLQIWLCGK